MHLAKILDIIATENKNAPFSCIKDLVQNGLSLDRFTDQDQRPNRIDLTHFLAAWCKRIGLEPELYCDWLIDYCVDVLAAISSSSASHIRHSTKSTIKYIHRSDFAFSCDCEKNIFKAACSPDCPIHEEMEALSLRNFEETQQRIKGVLPPREKFIPPPESLPVKERFKEQFTEAVARIKEYLDQGHSAKTIADLLNEAGYKTCTGRAWTAPNVSQVLREKPSANRSKENETASAEATLSHGTPEE